MDPIDFAKLKDELSEMQDRDLLVMTVGHLRKIGLQCPLHDKRIDRLETWRTGIAGGVATLTGIAYLAWEYVKVKGPKP